MNTFLQHVKKNYEKATKITHVAAQAVATAAAAIPVAVHTVVLLKIWNEFLKDRKGRRDWAFKKTRIHI